MDEGLLQEFTLAGKLIETVHREKLGFRSERGRGYGATMKNRLYEGRALQSIAPRLVQSLPAPRDHHREIAISRLDKPERPARHDVGSVRSPAPTDRQLHGPLRVQLRQGTAEQVRPGSKHPVGAALSRPGSRKDNELQPTERFEKTAFVEGRRSAASAKFLLVELDDHPREQR